MKFAPSLLLFLLVSTTTLANDNDVASKILAQHKDGPQVRELNWLNQSFMDKQRKSVNNLTSTHYGKRLRGDKTDIVIIQKLVNDEIVPQNDTMQLQALGIALGDILVRESPELEWVVYEDDIGATQAICIKKSVNCLFPVTMLSRRMEVGLKPDVNKVYSTALNSVQPFLQKLPYSVR